MTCLLSDPGIKDEWVAMETAGGESPLAAEGRRKYYRSQYSPPSDCGLISEVPAFVVQAARNPIMSPIDNKA